MTLLLIARFLFGGLLCISLLNTVCVVYLVRLLQRERKLPAPESLGKTAVLVCLRGADPNLTSCLRRLLAQDHPNYEVLVVVDSLDDPAWPIVQAAKREFGGDRLRVWPLVNRLPTCGLKNSSLVQLLDQLDPDHEVVVLADADLQSHPTWLRELVEPLCDQRIGATFGNRWFLPSQRNIGSLVRQVWNAPGLIVMAAFKIPWAGSLAVRRSLIEDGNLRQKWSMSIVDDGPIRVAAKQQGLALAFVPSLIMPNREVCDIRFAYSFIRRQLTWTRTYVATLWPLMFAYNLLAMAATTSTSIVIVAAWYTGNVGAMLWTAVAFAMALLFAVAQYSAIDSSARRVVRAQEEPSSRELTCSLIQTPLILTLSAIVGLTASFAATFMRRIVWRGVSYDIDGPWQVRMIKDNTNQANAQARTTLPRELAEPAANVSL